MYHPYGNLYGKPSMVNFYRSQDGKKDGKNLSLLNMVGIMVENYR